MKENKYGKHTVSVHGGKRVDSLGVVNAVEPSSSFHFIDAGTQHYPRYFNTPNQQNVANQICALENAPACKIFGSGMAAVSTTLMALLKRGDHIVLQDALYGGTHSFVVKEFESAGVEYTFVSCSAEAMLAAVKPNTRLIYAETPANPLLNIIDLKLLAEESRKINVTTIVDNTFASPINQNPIDLGIDVVVHSGTKYLGGHSDLSFGAVAGSDEIIERVLQKAVLYGGNVNALTCYMIERSIKTLAVRVQQQNQNARQIAEFLLHHSMIRHVNYPGLENHPGHAIATKQMTGFGGMMSFELALGISPKAFLKSLELIAPAMSLGGVETIVTIPALTSHKPLTAADREKIGISDRLVRMSVGVESANDLIQDLDHALASTPRESAKLTPDHAITIDK